MLVVAKQAACFRQMAALHRDHYIHKCFIPFPFSNCVLWQKPEIGCNVYTYVCACAWVSFNVVLAPPTLLISFQSPLIGYNLTRQHTHSGYPHNMLCWLGVMLHIAACVGGVKITQSIVLQHTNTQLSPPPVPLHAQPTGQHTQLHPHHKGNC